MKKISVLIVDNNILARQAIARILYRESSFVVVGTRGSVEDPSRHITNKKPDVVLLNVGSANSDGLTVLKQIRMRFPDLPVVVLSPRTKEGASAAVTALRFGAVDFVTKPESVNTILFAGRHFAKRLIPIIKVAAGIRESGREKVIKTEPVSSLPQKVSIKESTGKDKSRQGIIHLVTIGGCTGGPKALFSLIPNLPADFSVPVVVVQHFPRYYTSALAEKLDQQSDITVREAYDGAVLAPGVVWIASGGYHCEVRRQGNRGFLKCHRGQRENNNRPSIDTLFRSASQMYGEGVLGVVLSGWGNDGLAGSEVIRSSGGRIIVQDPKTSIAPEMPTSVVRAGLAEAYYPVVELTEKIVKQADQSREVISKKMIMQLSGNHFKTGSFNSQKTFSFPLKGWVT